GLRRELRRRHHPRRAAARGQRRHEGERYGREEDVWSGRRMVAQSAHATVASAKRSNLHERGLLEPADVPERRPVAIQEALSARRSPLAKYQELVVGSRSLLRLLLHEAVVTLTSWVPGALGLVLRRVAYPWLLGRVGRNPTFGHGVVLRHPGKVRLGDNV